MFLVVRYDLVYQCKPPYVVDKTYFEIYIYIHMIEHDATVYVFITLCTIHQMCRPGNGFCHGNDVYVMCCQQHE